MRKLRIKPMLLPLALGICLVPTAAAETQQAAEQYQRHCASCHGAGGAGDGPASAAVQPPPANFSDPAFWRGNAKVIDQGAFEVIKSGSAAAGLSDGMPAWGALLSDTQIREMVVFLRTRFAPPIDPSEDQ